MDYLNIAKTRLNQGVLLVGYGLVAIAIVIGTLVLLYQAYGFGLGKNGTVIQNGLAFFSSQPNPASIYINGKLNSATTNTRLVLPANVYQIRLSRPGYRDWTRTITLYGASVEHFDYPILFPTNLITTTGETYDSAPGVFTQSPNRRWLLVQDPDSTTNFDLYNLQNKTVTKTEISIPTNILSKATTTESWQAVSWADDNQHVLLEHNFDNKNEYILLDTVNPSQSVNLNTVLASNPPSLALNNLKYNQYYIYDSTTDILQTASLSAPTPVLRLNDVLAYQSYGSNTVLYVTADGAAPGQVLVKIISGTQTTTLRSLPAGGDYLIAMTQYNGVPYVAIGSSSINEVYIYRDPLSQLAADPTHNIVPVQILHVNQPNYLSFSDNAQFIMAENAQAFSVYDIENNLLYNYNSPAPLDVPQLHASWMDGDRLIYVSGGRLDVADYDNNNRQTLMPASANYLPVFSPNYDYMYALVPAAGSKYDFTQTSLLIPADQ